MNAILRNILAVLSGIILGSMVNMGIITISSSIIPPPAGVDVTTPEGLKAGIHLFEPINFLMPFLAHALGTFVGAIVAVLIAVNYKIWYAIAIGVFFLLGGISMVFMVPSPMWFNIIDLVGAYIPMAYLAYLLVGKKVVK